MADEKQEEDAVKKRQDNVKNAVEEVADDVKEELNVVAEEKKLDIGVKPWRNEFTIDECTNYFF